MRLALTQLNATLGKVEKNLEKHLVYIEEARSEGAEVIMFPELSLTG